MWGRYRWQGALFFCIHHVLSSPWNPRQYPQSPSILSWIYASRRMGLWNIYWWRFGEDCHWWSNTREEVITEVKEIGEQLKQKEFVKRELATVGNRIYVKWCTDITRAGKAQGITGYYGIFEKRHLYCCATYQSLDAALAKLGEIESRNDAEKALFNSFRDD